VGEEEIKKGEIKGGGPKKKKDQKNPKIKKEVTKKRIEET